MPAQLPTPKITWLQKEPATWWLATSLKERSNSCTPTVVSLCPHTEPPCSLDPFLAGAVSPPSARGLPLQGRGCACHQVRSSWSARVVSPYSDRGLHRIFRSLKPLPYGFRGWAGSRWPFPTSGLYKGGCPCGEETRSSFSPWPQVHLAGGLMWGLGSARLPCCLPHGP